MISQAVVRGFLLERELYTSNTLLDHDQFIAVYLLHVYSSMPLGKSREIRNKTLNEIGTGIFIK